MGNKTFYGDGLTKRSIEITIDGFRGGTERATATLFSCILKMFYDSALKIVL